MEFGDGDFSFLKAGSGSSLWYSSFASSFFTSLTSPIGTFIMDSGAVTRLPRSMGSVGSIIFALVVTYQAFSLAGPNTESALIPEQFIEEVDDDAQITTPGTDNGIDSVSYVE